MNNINSFDAINNAIDTMNNSTIDMLIVSQQLN